MEVSSENKTAENTPGIDIDILRVMEMIPHRYPI